MHIQKEGGFKSPFLITFGMCMAKKTHFSRLDATYTEGFCVVYYQANDDFNKFCN